MGKRWEALRGLFAVALLFLAFVSPVLAHKSPIIEYSYVGHIWEASYTTAPRVPVAGDDAAALVDGCAVGLLELSRSSPSIAGV